MTEREKRLLDLLSRMITALVLIQQSVEHGNAQSLMPLHLASAIRYLKIECPSLLNWVDLIYRDQNPPYSLWLIGEKEATESLESRL